MKPMSLTTPESIAREYGGNKKKIAEAARMGLLDPTAAVMAGMFIDKMRAAASAEQAQDTTVAQDIFGGGLGALQQPQQAQPQMQPQVQPQPQMAQAAPIRPELMQGVSALPAGNVGEYAGGGIVAFADRGLVDEDEDFIGRIAERGVPPMDQFPYGYREEDFGSQDRRQIRSNPFVPFSPVTSLQTSAKSRNKLIEPKYRTDDPAALARAKIEDLTPELNKQQQILTAAKDPADKARAKANIEEIQREISIASKDLKRGKAAPSPAKPAADVVKLSPDDPRAKELYDQRMRRDAVGTNVPPDYVGQARRITESVYPASEKPTELSVDAAFAQSKQFLDKAGVDLDVFKKQAADIKAERAGFAKDKEEAKTMRILEAAAGILSGSSPFAAVNIGKGMAPAIQGLGSDIKEFQKNERALRAAERQLSLDEQKFNLTRASDAQAQMFRSQDRVDKYNQKKADLVGDITKSLVSTQGSKEVAETYAKSYKELEEMRQKAVPDIVKMADRLKPDMPDSTEQQRLEKASSILYPGRGLSSIIGAESTASKAIEERFSNLITMNPKYKKLYDAALQGDPVAQQQIADLRDGIAAEVYRNRPLLSSKGNPPPSVGGAPKVTAPPAEAIQQLRANDTPQMRAYFDQTFGQGAAARALGK